MQPDWQDIQWVRKKLLPFFESLGAIVKVFVELAIVVDQVGKFELLRFAFVWDSRFASASARLAFFPRDWLP